MATGVQNKYQYQPLADPLRDIRLIELLPGEFGDEIRIKIFHAPMTEAVNPEDNRLPLAQLRELLPEPWLVHETVEGRYIFENPHKLGRGSWQWACPAKDVSPSTYIYPGNGVEGFLPRYEALSYTWGDVDGRGTIAVEAQQSAVSQLQARENLIAALRHLRDAQTTRTFWIDALCINQNDEIEKRSQIRRMRDIYRSAYQVVAWLGPEANSSHHAIQTLNYIGDQVEYLVGGHLCPSPDAVEENWHDPRTELPYESQTWDAVHSLFCRGWFDRVWIIQEILLADSRALIQCGLHNIPFTIFRRAATCIKENHHASKLETRLRFLAKITNPSAGLSFDRVVRLGSQRLCQNPRDYVYGVLGLAPKKLAAKVQPNYSKSVSQVYTDTTLLYSNHIQRLDILQRAYQYGRNLELPSWVPDLTARLPRKFPCSGQFSAGFSRAHFTFEAPVTLSAMGVQCARVTAVSSKLSSGGEGASSTIRAWQPENITTASYPNNETLQRAHLMTLRKGRVRERWVGWENIYPSFKDWELAWLRFTWGETFKGTDESPTTAPAADRHISDVINLCIGHVYVRTDTGYVGTAPLDAQIGNYIFHSSFSVPLNPPPSL
jgi:hypothetical protein